MRSRHRSYIIPRSQRDMSFWDPQFVFTQIISSQLNSSCIPPYIHSLPLIITAYVSDLNWPETLDLLWDLSNFSARARRTCHVASPTTIRSLNNKALLTSGSHKLRWMSVRLVAATCSRISPNFPTSLSCTVRDISGHWTAEENGSRIPSAMRTGTQPRATDSTNLGLHGAHPRGHRQKTDRTISDW